LLRWTLTLARSTVSPVFARAATLLLLTGICCFAQQPTPSAVYVAHDSKAVKDYKTNPLIVRELVDRLIVAVTGQPDVAKAWSSLVAPSDRVGIKISAAGGELFTTHRDVVNAIVDGLAVGGHSRNTIIVWDRSLGGAVEAGYKVSDEGYQLRAIAARDGYDRNAAFTAPLLGKLVWGDLDYKAVKGQPLLSNTENTSSESHFCRIVSSEVTKIINVPVMSDSATNGIAGCLYNVTIPNVDNWRRFAQASGFAASGIPEIYGNPLIAGKVVVNIMDGLIAEYAGGPASQPNYSVHYGTLLGSKDPVAVDMVALRQLEEWRKENHLPAIGQLATHVEVAAQMAIGNADPSRIVVKKIAR
jgi:hypothetical protein